MTTRSYAVGWNEVRHAFVELDGKEEGSNSYCEAVLSSLKSLMATRPTQYHIGAKDCVTFFQRYKSVPCRLSWVDKNEPWNNIEGSIPADKIKKKTSRD